MANVKKYEVVGSNLVNPETGKPYDKGEVIELTEEQADRRKFRVKLVEEEPKKRGRKPKE